MNDSSYSDFGIDLPDNITGQHYTTCPQCSHKRKKSSIKCLGVNADESVWHCNHCGWSGSLKKTPIVSPIKQKRYVKPKPLAPGELSKEVIEWFAKRKISLETLKDFDIQFTKTYFSQSKKEESAIVFPYKKNKEVINYKYRSPIKHFKQSKDAEKVFFNLDSIDKNLLIITEGEIDTMSFHQAGYTSVISVPDGAPAVGVKNFSSKFDYIENCFNEIDGIQDIIIAVDKDAPGQILSDELARRLGYGICHYVVYPTDCKDANEVLVKYGTKGISELIGGVKEFPISGVFKPSDYRDELFKYKHQGLKSGDSTGYENLNEHYTVRPGEMTIWTGYTGHGKSEFLDQLIINLADKSDWKFGICSLENLPCEQHQGKLISKYINSISYREERSFHCLTDDEAEKGLNWLDEHFRFFYPEDLSVDNLLDIAGQMRTRFGINGFILDPWNELEHKRPAMQSETDYISDFLSRIRNFARANKIHVWVVAHPTKPIKGKENTPPKLYDISGSANWANKADNGITVFRDFETECVNIHITKIRFKEIGKVGVVPFRYQIASGRYQEIDVNEIEIIHQQQAKRIEESARVEAGF